MAKIGLFLQYPLKSLLNVFKEFINNLQIGKEYTRGALDRIYKQLKSYESVKTEKIFLNKLIEIIFPKFDKNHMHQLNHWGILAKKNSKDLELLKLIIYLNSFKKAYIFKLECEIVYDFIELYYDAPITKQSFIDITIIKLKKVLRGTEYEGKEKNARAKFSLVNSSLSEIRVIKELQQKNHINLKYLDPDWRVFVLYMYEKSLPDRKISIPKLLKESEVKKHLFIKEQDIMQKLYDLEVKGFVLMEDTAGIEQIHLKYESMEKVINEIVR